MTGFDRRTLLKTGLKTGVSAMGLSLVPGAAMAADAPALPALFDVMFQEGLEQRPEGATQLGLDKGRNSALRARLSDQGDTGRAASRALTQRQIKQLEAVDRAALSSTDKINYDTVLYTRRSAASLQRFEFGGGTSPYAISQQDGAYQSVPDFLDTKHPVETATDADAYLARLSAFAGQLDANTDRMRHDVALGVVPPDFLLDKTLMQMVALRMPAADARVITSLKQRAAIKGLNPKYSSDAEWIYTALILPALDRQIAAVRAVRQKATHDAGLWKFKQGGDFYRAALAATTTTQMTPAEVHQFGLDEAKRLGDRIDKIMVGLGMTKGTLGARLAALYKQPGQVFPNTDKGKAAAIAYCNERLAAIRPLLPRAFKRMPPYTFEVRRVPKETEAGAASAFAQPPAIDGSRPGLVYFNLQDSAEWPKFLLDTVIYHEGLPGHQFEGGLSLSNTGLPLIRKTGGFSGYGEGWALYAEQVADELGIYEGNPFGQIGYLKMALFRAHRCIIDTGMHEYKWSRERAIALFVDGQGEAPGFAEREIDRYCASPGQACSYKIGHSVFNKLRTKAQTMLGAKYDIKDFHEAVLGCGRVPLEILERVGNEWIAGAAG